MQTHRQYFGVLGARVNRELLGLAHAKQAHFTRSRTSPNKRYPDWRNSTVIYEDQLSAVASQLEQEVRSRLAEVVAALRIPAFDIGQFEIQLTSHNDGEYYKWHTDNGTPDTAHRAVSFVYYFHADPKPFRGGELVFHADEPVVVEPVNDSMVLFDSRIRHEVCAVACPSRRFEDGRFTLNGWVRRRVPIVRADYFDLKIFKPPMRQWQTAAAVPRTPMAQGHAVATAPRVAMDEPAKRSADRLASIVDLQARLYRQSGAAAQLNVRDDITGTDFYESFYFLNRPLLLKGSTADSPAVRNWSPQYLARQHGSVPVQITANRDGIPDYELDFRRTLRTVTLAEFVGKLSLPQAGNDVYLVARNHFFDNPALAPLRDDLRPPPQIVNVADRGAGTAKLWMGPKGTVTPLHYDEHSIFFMQVFGRKRIRLIPPFDFQNLYVRDKYYSEVDPDRVDTLRQPLFARASVSELTLEPGDCLFIPAGWWHCVRSLDISISATFCSFHVEGRNTMLASPG